MDRAITVEGRDQPCARVLQGVPSALHEGCGALGDLGAEQNGGEGVDIP